MTLLMQPTDALKTIKQLITSAVTWWMSELEEMVPAFLIKALRKTKPLLVLTQEKNKITAELRVGPEAHPLPLIALQPTPQEIEAFKSSLEQKIGASNPKVLLGLDDKNLLIVQVNYPLSAELSIGKILSNEFNRITPFRAEDVYWDWIICDRDVQNNKLTIEIAITRRSLADPLLSTLHKYALSPTEVSLYNPSKVSSSYFHLLPRQHGLHPWKAGKLETVINFSLIASALLLLGALIYSPVKQAEKLEADLRKIRPAVDEAQTAKKHLQQLMTALTILNVQAQRPNALSILSTMTKLFPDSAWIYDFQLQGDEVRIAGFATDPSSLIGIINGEPHFREAKFLSPVITTNGMGQRFNLSFHVKVGDTK